MISFAGIDPGLNGAIAVIDENGSLVYVDATPTYKEGNKTKYMISDMRQILGCYSPVLVMIEEQHTFPKQGGVSNFRLGWGYGLWVGLCNGLLLKTQSVRPREWKKMFGLSGDKSRSIAVAQKLFPETDLKRTERCTRPHDGMAEALLIAEYGRRISGAEQR